MSKLIDYLTGKEFITSCIILIICAIACFVLGKTKKKISKNIEDLKDPKVVLTRRLILAARILIIVIGLLIICQINGINLMSLVAGLGIVSAVIGLALQDYLKDIIMGIHILSDRFFAVGECVEIGGKEGIIVGFSLTTTKIGDLSDHSITTICNRNINEVHKIRNRFVIDIPLSYKENAEDIHRILNESCKELEKISDVKECQFLGTQSFEASAILYRFLILCDSTKKSSVRRSVLFEIQKILAKENISIPFSQLDVHIDGHSEKTAGKKNEV